MNILILGNGFDLAHELKTKYKDFLEYCKQKLSCDSDFCSKYQINLWLKHFINRQNKLGETWIDLENEIHNVILYLRNVETIRGWGSVDRLCPQVFSIPMKEDFNFNNINKYIYKPNNNFKYDNENIGDKEYTTSVTYVSDGYFNVFINTPKGFINLLYSQLRDFTKLFKIYLKKEVLSNLEKTSKYKLTLGYSNCSSKDIFVLNFNYTDTCTKLYENYKINADTLYKIKTFYVHGNICSESDCDLVLGTHSFENKLNNEIKIPVMFNVFKKHNQRHKYNTIESYQDLLKILTNPKIIAQPIFHIIGHSLDSTDYKILKHILTINKNATIKIYYHDEEAQERLINRITEIIGEEEVMAKVRLIYQHDDKYGILKYK